MQDSAICQELIDLPIEDMRQIQLRAGRAAVHDDTREYWRKVHERSIQILRDDRRSHRAMALAEFVRVITYSLSKLCTEKTRPTYYTYTDVGVLDWFLKRERPAYAETRANSMVGILYLLEDISHYESDSQSGLEKRFGKSFDHSISAKRVALIREVVAEWERGSSMVGASLDDLRGMPRCEHVGEYVDDVSRKAALIKFSCFPQTECHDEYIFLRTIHMSELAFTGIQSGVEEAVECLKAGDLQNAERAIKEATAFALILHSIFRVLNTMPKAHFEEFRDATGDASAVQSRNYQVMEVFCSGVNRDKLATFERIEHLKPLKLYGDARFRSLRDMLGGVRADEGYATVIEVAREFDAVLLRWRGLHLAFAKTYLPVETIGTGGTSGASYLQRFLRQTIFIDTTFEPKKLTVLFPEFATIFESLRYEPSQSIAPPESVA
jgi:tryptophan 2,3-dioxygenase